MSKPSAPKSPKLIKTVDPVVLLKEKYKKSLQNYYMFAI
jgi:hypothetical protein